MLEQNRAKPTAKPIAPAGRIVLLIGLIAAVGALVTSQSIAARESEPVAPASSPGSPPANPSVSAPTPPAVVPTPPAVAPSSKPKTTPAPVTAARLKPFSVSGDKQAFLLTGDGSHTLVYLHGFCGDPRSIDPWVGVARQYGTLVAPVGRLGCQGQKGRFRFTRDVKFLDYRIKKSILSAAKATGRKLSTERIIVLGYSDGAERAGDLVFTYPKRYRRAVLMSAPKAPSYKKQGGLERMVVMRGEREWQRNYRLAAEAFDKAGTPSVFREFPGASHGQFGPAAPAVMNDVLKFITEGSAAEPRD